MTSTLAPSGFDDALRGLPCSLAHDDGSCTLLPVARWQAPPGTADEALLLRGCTGPTMDVGCGPGRLVAALSVRGVVALGIDVSPLAVALTRSRGAMALHHEGAGPSFPRCRVGADAATAVAAAADLHLLSIAHHSGRWTASLQRR
jgi:SAM-dependent methyltransferase